MGNQSGPAFIKRRKFPRRQKVFVVLLFVLPFMTIFTLFTVVPVVSSFLLSFTNFNMIQIPKWTGFDNYLRLFFDDDIFKIAMRNTLFFAVITGPLSYLLCFLFAWMINSMNRGLRSLMTLMLYIPSMLGNMAVIWKIIFSGDRYGLLNGLLISAGFLREPLQWLADVRLIPAVAVTVVLWSSLGTSFLAFIAGLQNIDLTLLEAGSIDGIKNRWQELYFIVLPGMRPQLIFGAVMSISASFGIGTAITALVGFPSTDYVVHTLVHHLEDYGTQRYQMGYASAIATLLFVIMVLSNKLMQKMIARIGR